jgi:hypothetical protein
LIENIHNPYTPLPEQRRQLDLVHKLNELHSQEFAKGSPTRSASASLRNGFQMQTEATDAFDLNKEPGVCASFTGAARKAISY